MNKYSNEWCDIYLIVNQLFIFDLLIYCSMNYDGKIKLYGFFIIALNYA